jgi:hypothetical protein
MFGRRDTVLRFIKTFRPFLVKQGSVVTSWRRRDAKKAGPYFRLTCRDADEIQHSIYIGRDGNLVTEVRDILFALQQRRQQARELGRAGPVLRRALRASRRELDEELAVVGLSRRGAEIRGWKNVTPAILAAVESAWHPSLQNGGATQVPEN